MANLQPLQLGYYGTAASILFCLHAASIPQSDAGRLVLQHAVLCRASYIDKKQDGETITQRRILDVLRDEYDPEEDYLPPTDRAVEMASYLVATANSIMQHNFPQGSVSTDGSGGLRI